MDIYTATEQAYKNGYNQGSKEVAEELLNYFYKRKIVGEYELNKLAEKYNVAIVKDKKVNYAEEDD